jgi:hypothetical protein
MTQDEHPLPPEERKILRSSGEKFTTGRPTENGFLPKILITSPLMTFLGFFLTKS